MFDLVNTVAYANNTATESVGGVGDKAAALQQWELVFGFIFPLIMSVIIRKGWSSQLQSVIAFGLIAASSLVKEMLSSGQFNFTHVWTSALTIAVVSISSYKGLWSPTGIAPKLEAATGGDPVDVQTDRALPNHVH